MTGLVGIGELQICLYHAYSRYLIIIGGINKFTKKILRPNASNNNELADFISRAPDNEELVSPKS